jgi:AraC family transcriptional regulator, transcriptional activator of pobA
MENNKLATAVSGNTAENATRVEMHLDNFAAESGGFCYKNQLLIMGGNQFNEKKLKDVMKKFPPVKLNVMSFILVLEGEMKITLDYIDHSFKKNTLIVISPFNTITSSAISPNCRYYVIMVTRDFAQDTMMERRPIPMGHFMNLGNKTGFQLNDKEMEVIKRCTENIYNFIQQKENIFLGEILHSAFYIFSMQVANYFSSINNTQNLQTDSRKDELIRKFLGLIIEYGEAEHYPEFYADKLCITVQYLSLILKEQTDNTAKHWIANNLIVRAKTMLRTPGASIPQIAEKLHFADQSSFGKFFKKHVGMSPKKYMQEN